MRTYAATNEERPRPDQESQKGQRAEKERALSNSSQNQQAEKLHLLLTFNITSKTTSPDTL
jgi:hypothetical protein